MSPFLSLPVIIPPGTDKQIRVDRSLTILNTENLWGFLSVLILPGVSQPFQNNFLAVPLCFSLKVGIIHKEREKAWGVGGRAEEGKSISCQNSLAPHLPLSSAVAEVGLAVEMGWAGRSAQHSIYPPSGARAAFWAEQENDLSDRKMAANSKQNCRLRIPSTVFRLTVHSELAGAYDLKISVSVV